MVGRQQRARAERDRGDYGEGQPGAPQAVGPDRERDGAAAGEADQHSPRLGEEGEADEQHRAGERRRPEPDARPRRAAKPSQGQAAKENSAAVPLR